MIRIILFDIATWCINAIPPQYRLTKFLIFIRSLCYGLVWNMVNFNNYRTSTTLLYYNSATPYNADFPVIYNYGVWVSLQSGNAGNTPDASPAWWVNVSPSFIGLTERITFTCAYLRLTWALNRQFNTTFRHPPYPSPYGGSGTFSDIYITNAIPSYVSPAWSTIAQPLNMWGTKPNNLGWFTLSVIGAASSYQYVIHFPVSVYDSLGATDSIRKSIISQFVNKYNIAGLGYSIVTY